MGKCGVTAYNFEDAMEILSDRLFQKPFQGFGADVACIEAHHINPLQFKNDVRIKEEFKRMLNLFCLWVLFFSVISVSTEYAYSVVHASDKSAISDEETVESLSVLLQNNSLNVRLKAIRKLESAKGTENRAILMKHFRKLPQAVPSTHTRQTEKAAVMRILINISESFEIRPFLLEVLKNEINSMREAKKVDSDIFYPNDITYIIISELEKQGITEKLRDMLADYVDDRWLHDTVRSKSFVPVILYDLERRGLNEPRDKVTFITENIVTRPYSCIPWNIYQDQQKRIEYGRTEAVINQSASIAAWLRSDEAVLNKAYEILLNRFGMTSVEILVAAPDNENYDDAKKDYFIYLASDILREIAVRDKALSADGENLMQIIRKYFDNMEDTGAFGRRYYVAGNLNIIYTKTGKDESVQIIKSEHDNDDTETNVIEQTSGKADNIEENIQTEDDNQSVSDRVDKLSPRVQKKRLSERVKADVTEQKEKKLPVIYIMVIGLFIIVFAAVAYTLYRKKRQF